MYQILNKFILFTVQLQPLIFYNGIERLSSIIWNTHTKHTIRILNENECILCVCVYLCLCLCCLAAAPPTTAAAVVVI